MCFGMISIVVMQSQGDDRLCIQCVKPRHGPARGTCAELSDEVCAALVLVAERRILLIGLELSERLLTLRLNWPARARMAPAWALHTVVSGKGVRGSVIRTLLPACRRLVDGPSCGAALGARLVTKPSCGLAIAARLHEDVEDIAVLVPGAPEILAPVGLNGDKKLVEMPDVPQRASAMSQAAGIGSTEGQAPLTDRLVGNGHASLGQQVFHVALSPKR